MNNKNFELPPVSIARDGTVAIIHPVKSETFTEDGFYTEFPMRLFQHRLRLGWRVIDYSGFLVIGDKEYHVIFLKNRDRLPFDDLKEILEARLDEIDRRCRAEKAIDNAFVELWGFYPKAEFDDDELDEWH